MLCLFHEAVEDQTKVMMGKSDLEVFLLSYISWQCILAF